MNNLRDILNHHGDLDNKENRNDGQGHSSKTIEQLTNTIAILNQEIEKLKSNNHE